MLDAIRQDKIAKVGCKDERLKPGNSCITKEPGKVSLEDILPTGPERERG